MANVLALIAIIVTLFNSASTQWPPYKPEGALCKSHLKTSGECTALENCTYNKQAREYLVAVDFIDCNAVSTNKIICCPNESFKSRLSELSNRFIEVRPYDDEELIEKVGGNYEDKAEKACQQFRQSFGIQRYLRSFININGGRRTNDNQLPFMAALGYSAAGSSDIHWDCGGNLISDRYVLTAAHCITNNRARGRTLVTIRLGEKNLVSKARNNSDYGVKSIILHPQYKPSLRYNDIALIHMDRAVTFTHLIRPACLPPSSGPAPSNGTRMVVAGWGAIDQAGFTRSEYLKEAQVVIVSRKKCQELIKAQRGLPQGVSNDMICAGDFRRGDDTCLGDSGGPLVVPCVNSATCTVIGITSFGSNPCGSNVPAVYTRVSSFVPWIESVVWP